MAESNTELQGPDLTDGISFEELEEGKPFLGHAHDEAVILVRQGDSIHAMDATCSHYGGPLADGVVEDGVVLCPWHHARFELSSGRAHGPALQDLGCYEVIRDGDEIRVGERRDTPAPGSPVERPDSVVIIGGGAAGAACAETLRKFQYDGPITVIAEEDDFPVDRPNLSKDFLAGNAPPEWLPVRPPEFYDEHDITWRRGVATRIDCAGREVELEDGETISYGALLLATGAEPRTLPIEGADLEHVRTLRSMQDSERIAELAEKGDRAVVIGASFIGLEAAASLRARDVDVTVVAPEAVPLQRVMGLELGRTVQVMHEHEGVEFKLGHRPQRITEDHVELDDGETILADLVVVGIGVSPRTKLAEEAGVDVDDGVTVDERMRTSTEAVFAAGDIARFPRNGSKIRIEHWTVAERQGEVAARSILGLDARFDDVPFFWSRHYDTSIAYVGHADSAENVEISGSLADRDATIAYRDDDGRIAAVATLGRAVVSMKAELAMGRGDHDALEALVDS